MKQTNKISDCDYFKQSLKTVGEFLAVSILLPSLIILGVILVFCALYLPVVGLGCILSLVSGNYTPMFPKNSMFDLFTPAIATKNQAIVWLFLSLTGYFFELCLFVFGPRFFSGMVSCARKTIGGAE